MNPKTLKTLRTLTLFASSLAFLLNVPAARAGSQTFTTVGNSAWTCPVNVYSVTVECWGGGGGGGGCGASFSEAGGGAGGSYVKYTLPVTPGTTYQLTVGSIGAAGGNTQNAATAGGTGGSSYFGNTTAGNPSGASILAVGGPGGAANTAGGTSSSAYTTSLGGTGTTTGNIPSSGATADIAGANGGKPVGGSTKGSGAGGAGANGGAGGAALTSQGDGNSGMAPGGGGSGGEIGNGYSSANGAGGAGAAGEVQLTWTAAPTLISPTKATIATTTATLGATVASAGDAPVTDYGVVWATTPNPTTANNKIQKGTSVTPPSAYTTTVTGLPAGTLIYYGGYATNTGGTSYSTYDSFYTLSTPPSSQASSLTATPASTSSIGLTWFAGAGASGYLIVQVAGSVAPNGVPASGVGYGVGASLGSDGGTVAAVVTPGSAASATISGLIPSTAYSYAIYAFAWDGADAGTYNYLTTSVLTASATTLTAPAITVTPNSLSFPPTAVNGFSSPLNYTVSGVNLTGNISITAPQNFAISTSSGSGFGSSVTLTQSGGSVPATKIYVEFHPTTQTSYSGNITHISSGANDPNVAVSGAGALAPSVTTSAATAITATGATLNGTVTSSNNATLTDSGFYYQATPGVTTSGTQLSAGGATLGALSAPVTGLSANQTYYYRAYAANAIGTGLDTSDTIFNTLANTPTAPTVSSPTQTSLNVAIGSGDGNPAPTTYAIQEAISGQYVQANGSLGGSAGFQTAAAWGIETVTGLTKNSPYTFQVEAKNSVGVTTAFGPSTPANTAASPFTPGNLAVLSPDNGTASQTTFSVLEITPSALNQSAPVQTISINGTNGNPGTALRLGTSATSGGLATSSDGTLLCLAGYNTTNTTGANTVLRGVGTLTGFGVFNMPAAYSGNGAAGNQTRAATTVDDKTFYWADKGGVYTNGESTPSDAQNILRVRSFGGTVYEINQQGFASVVSTVSADGATLYPLPNYPTATDKNANDFYLISSGNNGPLYDILYQIDASATNAGTIFKYSLVDGQWQANSSYITSFGGCSICAAKTVTGATLYVVTTLGTTDKNAVEELTDSGGYNAPISISDVGPLYTATGTKSLKSVAFVPVSYAVTYTGNNSTSGAAPMDNNNYGSGALVTVLGNTGNLAKTGYTFTGWNTEASGNGANVTQGVGFNITSNTTLYAQWTLIDSPATNIAECSTSVTYNWSPTGSPPFSYQWYQGSTLLTGQTASSLTLPAVDSGNAGEYYVVFTNGAGFTSNLVAVLTVVDAHPPVLSLPTNTTVFTGSGGVAVNFSATATDACAGSLPVRSTPASGSFFAPGVTLVTCSASDSSGNTAFGSFTLTVIDTNATTNILVNGVTYLPYSPNLPVGTWVWLDANPHAGSLMRASQRLLGEREVDEKTVFFQGLSFSQVTPTISGANTTYNYSAQSSKHVDTVGALVDKFDPIVVGPDGLAYITDSHHTVAAYLQPASPTNYLIPGVQRVAIGQIQENLYGQGSINDSWWLMEQAANNAYLYGTNGDQLLLPTDPNYSISQPILPIANNSPMPISPSEASVNGSTPMINDKYRSVGWGIRQSIVPTAFNTAGQISGYANTAPDGASINFVDFYWSDYLRNRLVWNNNLTPTGHGDTNIINAPLSFFAASANGIALVKSELYRDQNGRSLFDYTNSTTWTNTNTVYWAVTAIGNGLAAAGDTYNLYLRDDSTIVGDIIPSALSTNILHIDTAAGMVVTQLVKNMYALDINFGAVMTTTFPDTDVPNSTLTFPAGTGQVSLNNTNYVSFSTTVSNGICAVNGVLNSPTVIVGQGTLQGVGTINGAVTVQSQGTFAPNTLTISGALTLAGATDIQIGQSGSTLTNDSVAANSVTYGGSLTVTASGVSFLAGDTFILFAANVYSGSFSSVTLPPLAAGQHWDVSQLAVNGSIKVANDQQDPPSLSWSTPSPITLGTPLSSAQLNATANVAGTFTYNPASGAILPAGTNVLSVVFTPTDSSDWSNATDTVSVVVNAPLVDGSSTTEVDSPLLPPWGMAALVTGVAAVGVGFVSRRANRIQ